jgi:hypothetical protein
MLEIAWYLESVARLCGEQRSNRSEPNHQYRLPVQPCPFHDPSPPAFSPACEHSTTILIADLLDDRVGLSRVVVAQTIRT